jgi:hypothetical protein
MELSDFDLDLTVGQAGEQTVANLLTIETVEVKTDLRWIETGNLYVETLCWHNSTQSWELSGINVTKATHWAFNMEGMVLIVETYLLADACRSLGTPVDCNIEPNPSRGVLIKPEQIIRHVKQVKIETTNF